MCFVPKTPFLTVDGIIRYYKSGIFEGIVLIERKNRPFGWALPGGFVDVGETVEQAFLREMKEETSLEVKIDSLFNVYSDPVRDTRFHTASIVYIAIAEGTPKAMDDAKALSIYKPNEIPFESLAFDHGKILSDYIHACK